jgi:hypothetical protein
MHAKKNPAGSGEVPEKSKADTKGNGKNIPFGPESGKCRTPRKKSRREKKEVERKIIKQIEIDFPQITFAYWLIRAAGKPAGHSSGYEESANLRIGMATGHPTDGKDEKGKEGIATEDQRIDKTN